MCIRDRNLCAVITDGACKPPHPTTLSRKLNDLSANLKQTLDGVTACVVYTADSIRKFDLKSNRTADSIRDSIRTEKNDSQLPNSNVVDGVRLTSITVDCSGRLQCERFWNLSVLVLWYHPMPHIQVPLKVIDGVWMPSSTFDGVQTCAKASVRTLH